MTNYKRVLDAVFNVCSTMINCWIEDESSGEEFTDIQVAYRNGQKMALENILKIIKSEVRSN